MKIVVLTGAGISAESGVNTFRGADGLWEGHRIEEVASPEGFAADPVLVHTFYNARRAQLKEVAPNPAHAALARLEHAFGDDFLLVTQNVDDLHERGGSERIIHMHGELRKKRCSSCGDVTACLDDLSQANTCDNCFDTGHLRPHIVWFGEMPFEMDRINRALRNTDLFISIGTSGMVYPAAQFCQIAAGFGAKTIEINLEKTAISHHFHESCLGPAGKILPTFVNELLEM